MEVRKMTDYENESERTVFKCISAAALIAAMILTAAPVRAQELAETPDGKGIPKYVFLFIGDGMSYPQVQSAAYFGGKDAAGIVDVVKNSGNPGDSPAGSLLSFMKVPVAGSAQTYDATSFAPDSASTSTSIMTGKKTHSNSINVDITKKIKFRTIAEQLKAQKGWKIGVITTVNINHATPAAVYAHQASRKSNYPIGQELVASGFDYFAGGALMEPQDKNKDKTSIYDLAKNAGYKVVFTQNDAAALRNGDKAVVVGETLADADSLSYEEDRASGDGARRDYVKNGIDVINNKKGFFMMIEGGKIDWACHANDARSSIADTIALSDAVKEAVAFYNKHPKETLILVTADHETGGLTIGFAGTDYNLFFKTLSNQKISYAKFDSDYIANYKKNNTSFDDVMKDITTLFGLKAPSDEASKSGSDKNGGVYLTQYEYNRIKKAYDKTMAGDTSRDQAEYELYGTYEPLSVTITHILNNKSGIGFMSYSHTGLPVPVFAAGCGQNAFSGYYNNTDIYKKLAALKKIKKE